MYSQKFNYFITFIIFILLYLQIKLELALSFLLIIVLIIVFTIVWLYYGLLCTNLILLFSIFINISKEFMNIIIS